MGAKPYHPLDCPLCGIRMIFSPDCLEIGCVRCKVKAPLKQGKPLWQGPMLNVTKRILTDGKVILE